MKVRNYYVEKDLVKFVTEENTIREARKHLEETGFRCVPILDKAKKRFLGNVYEIDTYKYRGSLEDSVMEIADNRDIFIHEEESFFKIFLTIKKLPYLPVLNEKDEFIGILTHASVMSVAEDAFAVHTQGYSITVSVYDFDRTLAELTSLVSRFTSIQSLITLDSKKFARQIVFTIPETTSEKELNRLIKALEDASFSVVHVTKLDANSPL